MADNPVTPQQEAVIRGALAEFCHAQNAIPAPAGQVFGCWGFGEVPVVATDPAGRWWTYLTCLAGPTGLDETDLAWLWNTEYGRLAEWPRNAVITVPHSTIPDLVMSINLIHFDAAEHLFLNHSPWHDELRRNLDAAAQLLTTDAGHDAVARAACAGPLPPDP
jgi:hypothetical protein